MDRLCHSSEPQITSGSGEAQPVFYHDAAPLPRVPRAQTARQRPTPDRTPGTAVGRGSRQAGRTFPRSRASRSPRGNADRIPGTPSWPWSSVLPGGAPKLPPGLAVWYEEDPFREMVAPPGATIFTQGSLTRLFRTNWSRLDCGRPPRDCSGPVPPACATCRCSCACGSRRPCRTRRPDSGAPSRSSRSSAQPSVPA
jgi:hypothetical protein